MLDFLFYIFQAIGSFFIILLFFYEAIFLFIISAFCWSLAIHNILLLNIKKKYKIFFVGLILAIIFGSGAYKQDYIFLVCAVIFTPIFLYLLRKKLHNFYIFKLQKSLIAFGLFGTMVCVWQLEVPQMVVFEIASKSLDKTDGMTEILNENFNPNKFTYGFSKELEDCREKNINCPFFSFKFPIYNIYDKVNGEEIIVAREYGIAYSTSILTRVLTSMGKTKRIRYHISKNENNILY